MIESWTLTKASGYEAHNV